MALDALGIPFQIEEVEAAPHTVQLLAVQRSERPQLTCALRAERDLYLTAILRVDLAPHQAQRFRAVDESDDAMMPNLQEVR